MMGNGASTKSSWKRTFDNIKTTHDLAYTLIEEAITLEEQEKPSEAIEKYKEGILTIDQGLNIQVTCPQNPDFNWERACVMIQKMKKTRAEVLMRINSIQALAEFDFCSQAPPPSYEEAVAGASATTDVPRTYKDLAVALNNLQVDSTTGNAHIIYSHDDVRLYFISPDGTVSSSLQPQTLNVCLVEEANRTSPTAILQIGEWVYPLIPGVSPCYRTEFGAFILPDVHSDFPGSSIGIILPPNADASVYELLENILHGIVTQTPDAQRMRRNADGVSETISNGIVTGAGYISSGLIRGSQKIGELLNYGTPKLINNMRPAGQGKPISHNVSRSFQIAESATSTAATVTGYVADKVGTATTALGRFLAPHIQRQGTRLLTSGFHMSDEEASSKVGGVLTVAAGAVEGFSTVYRGLESGASILGRNLKDNTVKIVQHKYGAPAGDLTGTTFDAVGNVISVGRNVRILTPKGLVKKTARDAGRAIVEDYANAPQLGNAALYPGVHNMQQLEHSTTNNINLPSTSLQNYSKAQEAHGNSLMPRKK